VERRRLDHRYVPGGILRHRAGVVRIRQIQRRPAEHRDHAVVVQKRGVERRVLDQAPELPPRFAAVVKLHVAADADDELGRAAAEADIDVAAKNDGAGRVLDVDHAGAAGQLADVEVAADVDGSAVEDRDLANTGIAGRERAGGGEVGGDAADRDDAGRPGPP